MAKAPSIRTVAPAYTTHGGLTAPGGLVQRGGYAQERQVHIMSRPKSARAIKSRVGGGEQKLPKEMD